MSDAPAMSGDARFVAFASYATNLVSHDTNGKRDIFIRDRVAHTIVRVSLSSYGEQANGDSSHPAISADGRFIAFESRATNLTRAHHAGVFLRDIRRGTTSLVSVSPTGKPASYAFDPAISADGRIIAFLAPATGMDLGETCTYDSHAHPCPDVFVRDRIAHATERVSNAMGGGTNGWSASPSVSADGRKIGFASLASNLVPGDTNESGDAFVYDRVERTTVSASVDANGVPIDVEKNRQAMSVALSPDGAAVAFALNENAHGDYAKAESAWLYVKNLRDGTLLKVAQVCLHDSSGSLDWGCFPSQASFSGDGSLLAFEAMTPIVHGDRNGCYPWGRPGECPDIYLLKRATGHLERVSISSSELEGNGRSTDPAISRDGRFIAFASTASNLVVGDTNHGNMCYDSLPNKINCSDIFVRDRVTGSTSRASVG